ncbi:MAG: hypothetical protein DRQ41_05345, partial [Gammaproteobacteria bacterium]
QRSRLNEKRKEAINQIERYKQFPEIQQLENLKSWAIVFVGGKAEVVEEV